jgi:hypothetical protein
MAQINIVFFFSSTCPKDNTNSKKTKRNKIRRLINGKMTRQIKGKKMMYIVDLCFFKNCYHHCLLHAGVVLFF